MTIVVCPNPAPAPTHGVVELDLTEFRTAYPEFGTVSDAAITMNFGLATLIVNNSCCSIVSDATVRQQLLYLLTAHLTALAQGAGGSTPSGIVGRIDSATEGSVNVSAEYASVISQSMAYFIQTRYGALFWQLTAPFRTMRYVPPVQQCDPYMGPGYYNAWSPFGGGNGGPGCGC